MKRTKIYNVFIQELFYVLLAAIIAFAGLELLWPRIVLAYMNLNWLLMGWVVIGIVVIIVNNKK